MPKAKGGSLKRRSKTDGYVPPWFRLYHEIADDPKLLPLSETRRWRFLLVLVMNHRKLVPCDDKAAAYAMRIAEKEARETRKQLTKLGLVRGQWISPAFQKRQHVVSDHSTARVRRHRESLKKQSLEDGNDMKRVTVTTQSREEKSRSESEEIRENTEESGGGKRVGNGSAHSAPALTPLPVDFELTSEMREFAETLDVDAEKSFTKFSLHYQASAKKMRDWVAQYKKWCIEDADKAKPRKTRFEELTEDLYRRVRTADEIEDEDIRRLLESSPNLSDVDIAKEVHVTPERVQDVRKSLEIPF